MSALRLSLIGGCAAALFAGSLRAENHSDWAADFARPPAADRPVTWWRWVNGNINREAITRDLTAMAAKGIQGVGIFDVATLGKPGPVAGMGMMTPAWQDLFVYTVQEAARLGIKVRMSPAAGWGIGGPWVDAAHGAQALESAEVQIEGPVRFHGAIPRPHGEGDYYRQVAVLAFRDSPSAPLRPLSVAVSSALGGLEDEKDWPAEEAADGDPLTFWKTESAPTAAAPAWIQLHYAAPFAATGVYVAGAQGGGPQACELQFSVDGRNFQSAATFELAAGEAREIDFSEVRGGDFRLLIRSAHAPDVRLAEIQVLRAGDRPAVRPGIEWWKIKSAHRAFFMWPAERTAVLDQEYPSADGARDCAAAEVIDLSGRVAPDGQLDWTAPAGRWTVLCFGAVSIGEHSRMASKARPDGYEADVYSTASAEMLYRPSVGQLVRAVGNLAGTTLVGTDLDSYEIGATAKGIQGNWTPEFRAEFQRRRGYDPLPFLPAMARRIVDSRERTDRFLWDYRQTLVELYLDFYDRIADLAHHDGLRLWAENGYGTYPFQHIDGLASFGRADVPMGEFWFARDKMSKFFPLIDSVRTAASGAHVYGKRVIGAEALTTANGLIQGPGEWKTQLDREFTNGMNLVNLNCWTLQADVRARPGMYTYDMVNENLTWWDQSGPFLDYLARCQFVLQQGLPVADFCYFYGEGSAKFVPSREFLQPALPAGSEFDAINAEAVLTRLSFADGRLRLPDGVNYRYLVLPAQPNWQVSPAVLAKLETLVRAGATLIGPRPGGAPGLTGYPDSDRGVRETVDRMWGPSQAGGTVRSWGAGRLIAGLSPAEVLAADAVAADVDSSAMSAGDKVAWCHRTDHGTEIYYVSNQSGREQTGEISFRITGRQPELWDPVTGVTRAAPAFRFSGGRTAVPIAWPAGGSTFVVFRRAAAHDQPAGENFPTARPIQTVAGPWRVRFDPQWAGPAGEQNWTELPDWSRQADPAIRYYAGPAIYRTAFDWAGNFTADARIFLDLGVVKNLARVKLNGCDLGVVWTAPWRVDVTRQIQAGSNSLEIEVDNLWTNRLLHDQTLPVAQRHSDTTMRPLPAKTPPAPSGLLGPVTLSAVRR